MGNNRRISTVNHLVHCIVREHAIVVLSENCKIGRWRLQFFADRAIAFCIDAVARRTTRQIFRSADINMLSRCARTKSEDRSGDYQPFDRSRFRIARSLHRRRFQRVPFAA